MAGAFKKTAAWLGFVDDGRYDDLDQVEEDVFSAEETDSLAVSGVISTTDHPVALAPRSRRSDFSRIVTKRPRSYNDARAIGESFREGLPVIMNLSDMSDGEDKRLVDFAAGLIFGLRGNIERIDNKVFLLCPQNVAVGEDDKERLANGGFFNQS